jgi:beta-lactamase superfamily II metal-dependent hydrolase
MTKKRFSIHALMAGHGDCFWVEYGSAYRPHRILIDGGTHGTFGRLEPVLAGLPDGDTIRLLVVTHVDADHIGGALPLLTGSNAQRFHEVWFNGRKHLQPGSQLEEFGAVQGESLTSTIRKNGLRWNAAFSGQHISTTKEGDPVTIDMPGGAVITILSPGWAQLNALLPKWDAEVKAAGLAPGFGQDAPLEVPEALEALGGLDLDGLADDPFIEDAAEANGSSIAFLFEYEGKKALFAADAHPSVLIAAIKVLTGGEPLEVDVFKLPHHGSKHNVSAELVKAVRAKRYVFSSNGAYFKHPDAQAVARVIKYGSPGCELLFNCKSEYNKKWGRASLQNKWGYLARYADDDGGLSVHLLDHP